MTEAVDTIRQIIKDEENPSQIRLNACGLVLQNCLKYVQQVEIVSRIEALENMMKK